MGLADIVPGVSGGTMALILGIYTQFIDALKSLHLYWVGPLWRWVARGRKKEDWRAFVEEVGTMNLAFLVTLGVGIFTAIIIGSLVIPTLMEDYPVQMRAFFFGLIVASVWVPLKMISPGEGPGVAGVLLAILLGAGFGYAVTNPANTFELTRNWTEVESEGESLEELARRAPSAMMTNEVYWAPQNDALREAIGAEDPALAQRLEELRAEGGQGAADKDALKERAEPYDVIEVPAGVSVEVPRPAHWYVFAAGAIAISAMLLPGISGSYILLILGAYFFVLNALKGSIKALAGGELPLAQGGYVLLFLLGIGIGILSFARILSYLLHRFPGYTLGALVGLMVGCLRGIWPFRSVADGLTVNVMPDSFSPLVMSALAMFAVGMVVVGVLTWAGNMRSGAKPAAE